MATPKSGNSAPAPSPERVHPVVVSPDDGQAGHGQSLGRVSLGQDEGAVHGVPATFSNMPVGNPATSTPTPPNQYC